LAARASSRDELLAAIGRGADPLNLTGILTPGPRLAALTGNRVVYRDGLPIVCSQVECETASNLDATPVEHQIIEAELEFLNPECSSGVQP
jgi:hypothetical protein